MLGVFTEDVPGYKIGSGIFVDRAAAGCRKAVFRQADDNAAAVAFMEFLEFILVDEKDTSVVSGTVRFEVFSIGKSDRFQAAIFMGVDIF